jgi:hypothetical protein
MSRHLRMLSILVLVYACIATRPADSQTNGNFEGIPSITLSNDKLALTILVQGATFANLVLVGDAEQLSPLWNPVRMVRELGRSVPPTTIAGHILCVDGFGGVSAEERAAGLPGHGEAHLQTFEAQTAREGDRTAVTMTAKLPIAEEILTRTISMVDGENVVYVESQLESLLGFDRPINWAEHATVGSPFLESGVTVVDVSGVRSRTRPYDPAGTNSNSQTQHRLVSGQDFTWPMAPILEGKTVDMRATPENPHYMDHTTTLLDSSRQLGWATALNPKKRVVIGWIVRREEFPWLQTWCSYPPTNKLARGLEFSTQPFDVPRREAIGMGRLFDAPTYRWLPAKSKIQSRFLMFYTRVPDGFNRVDDVKFEGGRIIIEDRTAHKQVELTASRPL